jgi:membrane carboxypeptidase/penicillin-binding protein
MTLRTALAKSKNMVSIRLIRSIDPHYAQDYVSRFGFDKDTLLLGAGITVTAVSVQRTVATEANGFDLQNSDRAFDLMLTLSNGSATQTLHILDAYAFSTNNFWENALGVDLTYPQPLPIGETSVMIA